MLSCGFAKRDITPAAGIFLAGNGEYQSIGINDPLYAHAVVFTDNHEWVAFVSMDLIGIEYETVLDVRKRLKENECGKPENVFISCTHTHNGPHTRFGQEVFLTHRDEKYMERLGRSIAEAIMEADKSRVPVKMKYARGYAFENFNRRITMPDNKAYFYNPALVDNSPEIARQVHGVADPELDAMQLLKEDGSVFLTLVHYAAHPLTLGIYKHVISADFPGVLVKQLESHYKSNAVFFQGACGDLHSKGLFEGFQRMNDMGSNLAKEAIRILSEKIPMVENARLSVSRRDIRLPVDTKRSHVRKWRKELFGDFYRCEMGAVALGPLAFVAVPGEILCEPGLQIKCNSPFAQTWVLYNCNGYASYIAHRRAYLEGGYEGDTGQCLKPEACCLVLKSAEELLEKVSAG